MNSMHPGWPVIALLGFFCKCLSYSLIASKESLLSGHTRLQRNNLLLCVVSQSECTSLRGKSVGRCGSQLLGYCCITPIGLKTRQTLITEIINNGSVQFQGKFPCSWPDNYFGGWKRPKKKPLHFHMNILSEPSRRIVKRSISKEESLASGSNEIVLNSTKEVHRSSEGRRRSMDGGVPMRVQLRKAGRPPPPKPKSTEPPVNDLFAMEYKEIEREVNRPVSVLETTTAASMVQPEPQTLEVPIVNLEPRNFDNPVAQPESLPIKIETRPSSEAPEILATESTTIDQINESTNGPSDFLEMPMPFEDLSAAKPDPESGSQKKKFKSFSYAEITPGPLRPNVTEPNITEFAGGDQVNPVPPEVTPLDENYTQPEPTKIKQVPKLREHGLEVEQSDLTPTLPPLSVPLPDPATKPFNFSEAKSQTESPKVAMAKIAFTQQLNTNVNETDAMNPYSVDPDLRDKLGKSPELQRPSSEAPRLKTDNRKDIAPPETMRPIQVERGFTKPSKNRASEPLNAKPPDPFRQGFMGAEFLLFGPKASRSQDAIRPLQTLGKPFTKSPTTVDLQSPNVKTSRADIKTPEGGASSRTAVDLQTPQVKPSRADIKSPEGAGSPREDQKMAKPLEVRKTNPDLDFTSPKLPSVDINGLGVRSPDLRAPNVPEGKNEKQKTAAELKLDLANPIVQKPDRSDISVPVNLKPNPPLNDLKLNPASNDLNLNPTSNGLKPNPPSNDFKPSIPSNELKPNLPLNDLKQSRPSNDLKPNLPSNEMKPSLPSDALKPTLPSNDLKPNPPSSDLKPNLPSNDLTISLPSNDLKPNPPSSDLQPNPVSNDLKPTTDTNARVVEDNISGKTNNILRLPELPEPPAETTSSPTQNTSLNNSNQYGPDFLLPETQSNVSNLLKPNDFNTSEQKNPSFSEPLFQTTSQPETTTSIESHDPATTRMSEYPIPTSTNQSVGQGQPVDSLQSSTLKASTDSSKPDMTTVPSATVDTGSNSIQSSTTSARLTSTQNDTFQPAPVEEVKYFCNISKYHEAEAQRLNQKVLEDGSHSKSKTNDSANSETKVSTPTYWALKTTTSIELLPSLTTPAPFTPDKILDQVASSLPSPVFTSTSPAELLFPGITSAPVPHTIASNLSTTGSLEGSLDSSSMQQTTSSCSHHETSTMTKTASASVPHTIAPNLSTTQLSERSPDSSSVQQTTSSNCNHHETSTRTNTVSPNIISSTLHHETSTLKPEDSYTPAYNRENQENQSAMSTNNKPEESSTPKNLNTGQHEDSSTFTHVLSSNGSQEGSVKELDVVSPDLEPPKSTESPLFQIKPPDSVSPTAVNSSDLTEPGVPQVPASSHLPGSPKLKKIKKNLKGEYMPEDKSFESHSSTLKPMDASPLKSSPSDIPQAKGSESTSSNLNPMDSQYLKSPDVPQDKASESPSTNPKSLDSPESPDILQANSLDLTQPGVSQVPGSSHLPGSPKLTKIKKNLTKAEYISEVKASDSPSSTLKPMDSPHLKTLDIPQVKGSESPSSNVKPVDSPHPKLPDIHQGKASESPSSNLNSLDSPHLKSPDIPLVKVSDSPSPNLKSLDSSNLKSPDMLQIKASESLSTNLKSLDSPHPKSPEIPQLKASESLTPNLKSLDSPHTIPKLAPREPASPSHNLPPNTQNPKTVESVPGKQVPKPQLALEEPQTISERTEPPPPEDLPQLKLKPKDLARKEAEHSPLESPTISEPITPGEIPIPNRKQVNMATVPPPVETRSRTEPPFSIHAPTKRPPPVVNEVPYEHVNLQGPASKNFELNFDLAHAQQQRPMNFFLPDINGLSFSDPFGTGPKRNQKKPGRGSYRSLNRPRKAKHRYHKKNKKKNGYLRAQNVGENPSPDLNGTSYYDDSSSGSSDEEDMSTYQDETEPRDNNISGNADTEPHLHASSAPPRKESQRLRWNKASSRYTNPSSFLDVSDSGSTESDSLNETKIHRSLEDDSSMDSNEAFVKSTKRRHFAKLLRLKQTEVMMERQQRKQKFEKTYPLNDIGKGAAGKEHKTHESSSPILSGNSTSPIEVVINESRKAVHHPLRNITTPSTMVPRKMKMLKSSAPSTYRRAPVLSSTTARTRHSQKVVRVNSVRPTRKTTTEIPGKHPFGKGAMCLFSPAKSKWKLCRVLDAYKNKANKVKAVKLDVDGVVRYGKVVNGR